MVGLLARKRFCGIRGTMLLKTGGVKGYAEPALTTSCLSSFLFHLADLLGVFDGFLRWNGQAAAPSPQGTTWRSPSCLCDKGNRSLFAASLFISSAFCRPSNVTENRRGTRFFKISQNFS